MSRSVIGLFMSLLACLLLSACGAGNTKVPLGTWKDVEANRYITIEEADTDQAASAQRTNLVNSVNAGSIRQYSALLFSVHEAPTPAQPDNAPDKIVIRERVLPATMVNGVFTIKAGATDISVLYHPSGELILVNGVSEFRRVSAEIAENTLAKLQDP